MLAVENTDRGSPVSEKMVNAYLAGAVPVVWGGGLHRRYFNPESFVDCSSLEVGACAAAVRAVEANETRREAMRAAARFSSPSAFESFFAWSHVPLAAHAEYGSALSDAQRAFHDELGERLGLSMCRRVRRRVP